MHTYTRTCTSPSYMFRQLVPSSPEDGTNCSESVLKRNATQNMTTAGVKSPINVHGSINMDT